MDHYIKERDVKVSFFISNTKGAGTMLLDYFTEHCKLKDINYIYLWTDSTCNHSFYPKKGFSLFFEDKEGFASTATDRFSTMFYKKINLRINV